MSEPALHVANLNVELSGRQILRDVNFAANHGEVFAILGPNGAGKSTLLRAIAGLLPYGGTMRVQGHDLAEVPSYKRVEHLAYVPQNSRLASPIPVADVVAQARFRFGGLSFASAKHQTSVLEVMRQVDIEHLARRPFTELSGGEQRRVLLARAIATGARIILLDEPTASLDIAHALSLYRLLRELAKRGYCVIAVLHDLGHAHDMTDRALLLQEGQIAAFDASELVICPELVRQVYGVEMSTRSTLSFDLNKASS